MSFPLWTDREATSATGGTSTRTWQAEGISIDSRTLLSGDLFVALSGPNHDGHAFVQKAKDKGAAAAIVSKRHLADLKSIGLPLLAVDDPMRALTDLARIARTRNKAKIVAVTGSVGKTGTKEALILALSSQGMVHATQGNLNNHIGLPLTLARLPKNADFAVLEMGMNHLGEIEPLSRLARPHIAIITTVEPVHLEFFSDIQAIADAKAEVLTGLIPEGLAVLPRDNALFHYLCDQASVRGVSSDRIVSFGEHREADVRLLDCTINETGCDIVAICMGQQISFHIGATGEHWARNCLAILAVVQELGLDLQMAANALTAFQPPKGRGRILKASLPSGGNITIIDESYNASPPAMHAAIQVLGQTHPGKGGRRIAVLGDMLELGEAAAALHSGLSRTLQDNHVDMVFTAGPNMAKLADSLPAQQCGAKVNNSLELISPLSRIIQNGDVVMVKGSLGSNMAPVVQALSQASAKQKGGFHAA